MVHLAPPFTAGRLKPRRAFEDTARTLRCAERWAIAADILDCLDSRVTGRCSYPCLMLLLGAAQHSSRTHGALQSGPALSHGAICNRRSTIEGRSCQVTLQNQTGREFDAASTQTFATLSRTKMKGRGTLQLGGLFIIWVEGLIL
jgi:hypothetical protein